SRVKRLDIPSFNANDLTAFLTENYADKVGEIESAVKTSNGKLGEAINALNVGVKNETELCYDIILNLKSSKDAYKFASKINKENYRAVLSAMLKVISNVFAYKSKKESENIENSIAVISSLYSYGALIHMSEKFTELEKKANFNLNVNAVADGILFGVLEGKFKWQK
ncbi:MAG: hypothetical protein J6R88_02045, partial [Clostridia bacterium]|nr:hypothetical protein [Clostridia bacterium]